jgi:thymidylate synthase
MPRLVIQCREEYLEDGLRVIVCRSGDLVLTFPPWANKRLLKRYIARRLGVKVSEVAIQA